MRRILHFIETTGPGGAETIFLSLLEGLDRSGWAGVPVLTGPGWLWDQVEALGSPPRRVRTGGRFDLRLLRDLRNLIRTEAIDLVQAHLQGSAVYGSLAAAWEGVPVVATFHGFPDLQLSGAVGGLKRRLLSRTGTRLVFVSEALRRRGLEAGIATRDRSEVIWNGIDRGPFLRVREGRWARCPAAEDGVFHVGSIGNVRPAKDYGNLLRAAAWLETQAPGRFRFTIFGQRTDPLYSELLDLRSGLGLDPERFVFAGFVTDIALALEGVDCVAIPSSSEGFSLAAIQAMAAGVPVVATRCGGPEDIVDHGKTGELVPARDPHALGRALWDLLRSPDHRLRLARAAADKADRDFSLEAMIARYESTYREVLESSRGGSTVGRGD